jgi:hypothetical protein
MTLQEILSEIAKKERISRKQFYCYRNKTYFAALKIEPVGARQKPQRFPDDTAVQRFWRNLGFRPQTATATNGATMPSLSSLKTVRTKARRAK